MRMVYVYVCTYCVLCVLSLFFPLLFPISYFLHSRVAIPHPAPVKKSAWYGRRAKRPGVGMKGGTGLQSPARGIAVAIIALNRGS